MEAAGATNVAKHLLCPVRASASSCLSAVSSVVVMSTVLVRYVAVPPQEREIYFCSSGAMTGLWPCHEVGNEEAILRAVFRPPH